MIRTYSHLITLPTFEERFEYLKLYGKVGAETFGRDRYLNQMLYRSNEWKRVRNLVIARDLGCDLGVEGYDILGKVIVHHMNPITLQDVLDNKPEVYDPEFLISVSEYTHNGIHYGDDKQLPRAVPINRTAGDTCPWKWGEQDEQLYT